MYPTAGTEVAAQINLSLNNVWGIVKMIMELLMKKPDGQYVLLKDPNKAIVRLYAIPHGDLDESGGEDDDEDEEGREGDDDEDEGGGGGAGADESNPEVARAAALAAAAGGAPIAK